MYELNKYLRIYFVFEYCDKIMHFRFDFDAYSVHLLFVSVQLKHQNLSARALFCHNSLATSYFKEHIQVTSDFFCEGNVKQYALDLLVAIRDVATVGSGGRQSPALKFRAHH